MNIVTQLKDWQQLRKKMNGSTIGFVPTMGNLHLGHLSLFERAKKENEFAVASIFVNPTQFHLTNDFENYPQTKDEDIALLQSIEVDYVLLPTVQELYQDDYQTRIAETKLSLELEGEYRPGHFTGMLTVVLKLLNLTQPTCAYFGEKDYQQLLLIKKMVQAFFLPTEIKACKTIRAADGVALSSRNARLTPRERQKLALFPQLLKSHLPKEKIMHELELQGFKVEYIEERWQRRLGAVWLGNVRLIDNVAIGEKSCCSV